MNLPIFFGSLKNLFTFSWTTLLLEFLITLGFPRSKQARVFLERTIYFWISAFGDFAKTKSFSNLPILRHKGHT